MDGFRDGSGLFGVAGSASSAECVLDALASLQHRGGAGLAVATADGTTVRATRARGRVDGFDREALETLPGTLAIGQVFGGLGPPDLAGLPLDGGDRMVLGHTSGGPLAAAIAGRFTNGTRLRRELKEKGALFQTESDAEVLLHLVAQSAQRTTVNRLVDALWKVEGAFSALLLGPELLVAVRDPRGFRPLVVGQLDGALVVSSEDVAIREVGGTVQRAVAPGEMVVVLREAVQSVRPFPAQAPSRCAQELVGLARHDASIMDRSPYEVRTKLGERVGRTDPADVDLVLALPHDEPFALGYARSTGHPYERGLLPRYGASGEDWMVVPSVVQGRRVAIVSRSLLTGAEARKAVSRLRAAGAVEVHVRVATPPIARACVYGVPSPTTDELASARRPDPEDLRAWLDADTVGFLPLEALVDVLGTRGWCTACVSGDHPVAPEEADDQLPLF
ncbi:MAG: hypothetical protein H6734_00990 [Alphaproteobacteria bacterium]|nr:hypothetical protein [Alphaproteobacteria bacterium]